MKHASIWCYSCMKGMARGVAPLHPTACLQALLLAPAAAVIINSRPRSRQHRPFERIRALTKLGSLFMLNFINATVPGSPRRPRQAVT